MNTLVFSIEENHQTFGIKLYQTGRNEFTVEYGKEIERDLSYSNAALSLGKAIMRMKSCEGILKD